MPVTKRSVDVLSCSMCDSMQILPNDLEEGWFKIRNPRTAGSIDPIENLDFCTPACLVAFVSDEWKIEKANGMQLLNRQTSTSITILEFIEAYSSRKV